MSTPLAQERVSIRLNSSFAPARVLVSATLLVLFSILVIDGYPAGSVTLREFGARPANFLLAIAMAVLVAAGLTSSKPVTFSRRGLVIGLVAVLGIPAANLPVALLLQPDTPVAALVADWGKQYAMLLWGLSTYLTWRTLLKGMSSVQLGGLICGGAILPLLCFYGDFAGSSAIQGFLGIFRLKQFVRPSGLATEPSLYAAWVAFVWPLMLFYATHARSLAARAAGMLLFLALCASAYLSQARTIAVIVMLQVAFYALWVTRQTRGVKRFRALVLVGGFGFVLLAVFAASLSTLGNAEMGSNISRIGSTVTSARVAWAHPLTGVGIGQLKYFFGAYAPDFALASDEILAHATGVADYRASSFNIFVRFVCEFGFVMGLWFAFLVVRPIATAIKLRGVPVALACETLAAIGGVGFWLSADQYGYQPAIVSLAILANSLEARSLGRQRLRGTGDLGSSYV